MPCILLKDLLLETSVFAIPSGHGTKNIPVITKALGRRYLSKKPASGEMDVYKSPEYTLTPQEVEYLNTLAPHKRIYFLTLKREAARRARGQCIYCKAKMELEPGAKKVKSVCPDCTARRAKTALKSKQKRIEQGKCAVCGNPAIPSTSMCGACRTKQRAAVARSTDDKLKMGICSVCGKNQLALKDDGTPARMCSDCLARYAEHKRRERQRKKEGEPPIDYTIEN